MMRCSNSWASRESETFDEDASFDLEALEQGNASPLRRDGIRPRQFFWRTAAETASSFPTLPTRSIASWHAGHFASARAAVFGCRPSLSRMTAS